MPLGLAGRAWAGSEVGCSWRGDGEEPEEDALDMYERIKGMLIANDKALIMGVCLHM